jgi:hypothetical protein
MNAYLKQNIITPYRLHFELGRGALRFCELRPHWLTCHVTLYIGIISGIDNLVPITINIIIPVRITTNTF